MFTGKLRVIKEVGISFAIYISKAYIKEDKWKLLFYFEREG